MKFGVIPQGPTEQLLDRARKLNKSVPVVLVDEMSCLDPELTAVFVFKPHRAKAEDFNLLREQSGVGPFAIVDVPLSNPAPANAPPALARPINSIRGRLSTLLKDGPLHGYDVFKKYRARYGKVSMRLVYYHLNRGLKDGLFEVADVQERKGDFSWGETSRRKYYKLRS